MLSVCSNAVGDPCSRCALDAGAWERTANDACVYYAEERRAWYKLDSAGDGDGYDTIRHDGLTILTCAQKLTSSQLSLPHGTKQKEY